LIERGKKLRKRIELATLMDGSTTGACRLMDRSGLHQRKEKKDSYCLIGGHGLLGWGSAIGAI
jgi:hypothetical protein